jgi:hypothetical protein
MKYIFLLSASLILLSCSKSKKNEKNVIGTWNISEFYNSIQTTTQSSTYFSDTTVYNIGTLTFKSDGTGKFDVPSLNTSSFKWTNDKENIYLEFNNSTQLDTLEIIESSKNKLILHSTDIGYTSSGTEKYQYKYTLTK